MKGIRSIKHWCNYAFNLSILEKKRLPWVDYLRGIAIVLVVYRHALLGIERSNIATPQILTDANMIFYSFRMPLFFILSGIFISKTLAKKSYKTVIGIRFENLLYPYFIWAFLQVSLQIVFGQFTNSHRGLVDYTYIFYHPRYLDQFWYLPALFNATMIYLLVQKKFNPKPWSQLLFGIFLYFLSPLCQQVSMISDWMEFYIFFAIGDAASKLFFKESVQRFFAKPLSFVLITPLFIAAQIFYLKYDIGGNTLLTNMEEIKANYLHHMLNQTIFLFIALVGCITMFHVAFLLQRFSILSILRVLGYHSLYIYVMHVIVTGFIRLIFPSVLGIDNPVVILLAGIFFGISIPIIAYNTLIKNNAGWFLFGYKKKKPAAMMPPKEMKHTRVIAS
jgi:fucose 4-O-acetylase-like acetyltransferase